MILLFACFWLLAGCEKTAQRMQPEIKRLDESVKYSIPDRWQVMKQQNTADIKKALYFIPYPPADGTRHSANAFIIIRHCPVELKVRELDVGAYHNAAEGYIIVNDVMDSDKWRTVLSEAHDEVPYMFMERFGSWQGVSVYFNITFPLMKEKDADWHKKIADEFNQTVKSLEILK